MWKTCSRTHTHTLKATIMILSIVAFLCSQSKSFFFSLKVMAALYERRNKWFFLFDLWCYSRPKDVTLSPPSNNESCCFKCGQKLSEAVEITELRDCFSLNCFPSNRCMNEPQENQISRIKMQTQQVLS